MGAIYSVTCTNKGCRYHTELRYGPGMRTFVKLRTFEEEIREGCVNEEVRQKLKSGAKLEMGGIYLCPTCNVFRSTDDYYLMENITESPFGTIRYDVSFPFGVPRCEACGNEMSFIRNILSSKVKCPRCDGPLRARLTGHFD